MIWLSFLLGKQSNSNRKMYDLYDSVTLTALAFSRSHANN